MFRTRIRFRTLRALGLGLLVSILAAPLSSQVEGESGSEEIQLDDDLAFCTVFAAAEGLEKATAGLGTNTGARLLENESARSLAAKLDTHARTVHQQLLAVAPAHTAFVSAWERFDGIAKSTGMSRSDRVLRSFMPGYGRSERELATMLGCNDQEEYGESLCPCPAIPIAHQLAELGLQLHTYVEGRFADSVPDAITAVQALDHSSATLHELLHSIEIEIPRMQETFARLEGELGDAGAPGTGNAFDRVREAFVAFEAVTGRCQVDPESSMPGMSDAAGDPHPAHGEHSGGTSSDLSAQEGEHGH